MRRHFDSLLALLAILSAIALSGVAVSKAVTGNGSPRTTVACPVDPIARWGLPEGNAIRRGDFLLDFDEQKGICRWSLEYLERGTLKQPSAERSDNFFSDPDVAPEFRTSSNDYRNSGWPRGHQAAADNHPSKAAKDATFSMANMAPQNGRLNSGLWRGIECLSQEIATFYGHAWVITCPLFVPQNGQLRVEVIGERQVWVPTHFGKSVLVCNQSSDGEGRSLRTWRAYTWIVPNEPPPVGAKPTDARYRASVDQLERAAGLDLWSGVPDVTEAALEASVGTGPIP